MHNIQKPLVHKKSISIGSLGLLFILVLLFTQVAWADVLAVSEDFESFTGTGFATAPAAGQLDADIWRVTGMSDGSSTFGTDATSGDFARGSSSGGTVSGGVYAFDTGSNVILGVQPGGSDFTPGTITMRLRNNSGATVTAINVAYDIFYLNDQGRANSLNFSYSTDDSTYTPVGALDFTTAAAADVQPAWASVNRTTTITSLSLAPGDLFYIRWEGDDESGSGSRDEYGIDNLTVSELDATAVTLQDYRVNSSNSNIFLLTSVAFLLTLLTMAALDRRQRIKR